MANPTLKPEATTNGLTPTHDSTINNYWQNLPSTSTPIIDLKLNDIEKNLDALDTIVLNMDNWKAQQNDVLPVIKDITFNSETGTFTITRFNNVTYPIDTDIEKIAVNFDYDDNPSSPHYQQLIITLDDAGPTTPATVKYVDLSALITEYEFTDTSTIHFAVGTDGEISASVIDGSITESKLQPNFLADCRAAAGAAESSATNSSNKALVSEGWAVGTQNGTAVTSGSPYYHNNAKWWEEQAQQIAAQGLGGLGDVTIDTQTLANKQILEYHSSNQQWENVDNDAMPWSYNDKTGTKNLNSFPYYLDSASTNGVVFTTGKDGTVTAVRNYTSSSSSRFNMHSNEYARNKLILPQGTYKLTGCPAGGGNSSYYIGINYKVNGSGSTIDLGHDRGSGLVFTISDDNAQIGLFVNIDDSVADPSNLLFKPMIVAYPTSLDASFQPYAKTNQEITHELPLISMDMYDKTYKFENDGSISVTTNSGYSGNIEFLSNGNIQETYQYNGNTYTKLYRFTSTRIYQEITVTPIS